MPKKEEFSITEPQRDLLEKVKKHYQLDSIDQAAEWLAKRALRKHTERLGQRRFSLAVNRKD